MTLSGPGVLCTFQIKNRTNCVKVSCLTPGTQINEISLTHALNCLRICPDFKTHDLITGKPKVRAVVRPIALVKFDRKHNVIELGGTANLLLDLITWNRKFTHETWHVLLQCETWHVFIGAYIWQTVLLSGAFLHNLTHRAIYHFSRHLGETLNDKIEDFSSELLCVQSFTTVFVDTRLWKAKHSRKRFQKFPSIIRVIDMSDRNPPITATSVTLYVMLAGCDWWISIRHVDNTYDWRKFWKSFRECFVFQSRVSTKTVETTVPIFVCSERRDTLWTLHSQVNDSVLSRIHSSGRSRLIYSSSLVWSWPWLLVVHFWSSSSKVTGLETNLER